MTKKETVKRYILFLVGMFFISCGVAIAKHSELGVTTISSVANVVSIKFDFISIGSWIFIWNMILIMVQMAILRKDFKSMDFMQIGVAFTLGYATDLCLLFVSLIPLPNYYARLATVIVGIIVLSFGISITFIADTLLNAAEAFVKVIGLKTGKNLGNIKMALDASTVSLAIILSLIFFDGQVIGVREGTIIAVFLIGPIVKRCNKLLEDPLNRLIRGS
ncbi:MAG: DUF6198 family protein [Eubacteriales bacterium]|nr:DUF6198 family protein [Eubacteriales bacterium]